MAALTYDQVAAVAAAAGFAGDDLAVAVAVTGPESGRNPAARLVTRREDSRGLWQINTYAHPWSANLNLYDPAVNAAAAYRVYAGAGNTFRPWTGYTSRTYLPHLPSARAAVARLGAPGTKPGAVNAGRSGDPNGGPSLGGIAGAIIGGAAGSISNPIDTVAGFLALLTSGTLWLRVAQLLGGAVLTIAGVLIIARDAIPTGLIPS